MGVKVACYIKCLIGKNNNNKSNCKTFKFAISFRFLIPSIRSHLADIRLLGIGISHYIMRFISQGII